MASSSHDVSTRPSMTRQTSKLSHIRAMTHHDLQKCGWASIRVFSRASAYLHQLFDRAAWG